MKSNIKKTAINAVKKSGKFLVKAYKNFDRETIQLKSHHEILTKADLMSEEIIIKEIKKDFPNHSILSEESGKTEYDNKYLWIIDPVDGTTNFSIHNPLWSISLAVAELNSDGGLDIILGIVYAPMLDELYVAELGKGAKLNNKKIAVSGVKTGKVINTFCHGSKTSDIKKAIAYYGKQKLSELDCRQMGSAAIELAYTASGRVESFTAPGANDWDVAAGVLLVREAGGIVTDFTGKDWQIGSGDIIASNGKAHKNILRVIR